jgi:hypothetical protein
MPVLKAVPNDKLVQVVSLLFFIGINSEAAASPVTTYHWQLLWVTPVHCAS